MAVEKLGGKGYSTHGPYLREFHANFYVLSLSSQDLLIAFDHAINDEEQWWL